MYKYKDKYYGVMPEFMLGILANDYYQYNDVYMLYLGKLKYNVNNNPIVSLNWKSGNMYMDRFGILKQILKSLEYAC